MNARTFAFVVGAVILTPAGFHSWAAAEPKAPEGCYLKLERDGTYMCCRQRGALVCHKLPSTIDGGTESDSGSKQKQIATPGGGTIQP
jgi:hypothetical protein